jgi:hypothetical protein
MSGIMAFFIGVGVVSLACLGLMMRADRLRYRRRAYADSSDGESSTFASSGNGLNLLGWFGSSSWSSDSACSSSDSGSADSGCSDGGGGGDSGSGGDGGGGGGGD